MNVTTHPHSPEAYSRRILAAATERLIVELGRDRKGLLHSAYPLTDSDRPVPPLEGDFLTFMDITPDDLWFNIERMERAHDGEVQQVSIPPSLRPKMKSFRYLFFPESHILVFEIGQRNTYISPRVVERLFRSALNSSQIVAGEPEASVILIQDHAAVDRIFAIHKLTSLSITLKRPNPDGPYAALQAAVFEAMEREGVESKAVELGGRDIRPTDETRQLAQVAAAGNGSCVASGRNENGKRVSVETADHPVAERAQFVPDEHAFLPWFRQVASDFLGRLRSRGNPTDQDERD